MKSINYDEYFQEFNTSLSDGGTFLTVKNGGELNTMTIGWATVGISWSIPVMLVLVRKSRYTYKLIEEAEDFTVSVPFGDKMKDELLFCGTESGRDYDKFAECDLEIESAQKVSTPIITDCDLHYECRIKYKQAMKEERVVTEELQDCYPQGDYHSLYFGKIVASYLTD